MIVTSAAISIFIVSYALIVTERAQRDAAALGGVTGMVVIGLVDADTAYFDQHTGVDWNVILLLSGAPHLTTQGNPTLGSQAQQGAPARLGGMQSRSPRRSRACPR